MIAVLLPFKIVNLVMVVVFILSAGVQFNDPDPVIWIMIYLSAAALSVVYATGRHNSTAHFILASIALLWSMLLIPDFWGRVPLADTLGRVDMKTEAIEAAREFGGLLIISTWMFILGRRATQSIK